MSLNRWSVGDCGCECGEAPPDGDCYEFDLVLSFGDGHSCNTYVYANTGGGPVTGCFPMVGSCGIYVDVGGVPTLAVWIGQVCYEAGTVVNYRITGYIDSIDDVTFPDESHVCFPDDVRQGSKSICVIGCDGEPLAGATVVISSTDPSGPFVFPPPIDDGDILTPPIQTDESGCLTYDYPAGLDSDAELTIKVNAPDQYEETTIVITVADLEATGGFVVPNVAPQYTCCDMDFRKGPINPSAHDYRPRADLLLFTTSGGYEGEIDVDCDGNACALTDEIEYAGGIPSYDPFSDWYPPTIGTDRCPCLVRVWYDGDWHCQVKVKLTYASSVADQYGWVRSDADCDENADPKLSVPSQPAFDDPGGTDPIGTDPLSGSFFYGSTGDLVATAVSYDVNTNNPVDITFHFDPINIPTHDGTSAIVLVDSITVWQPV